MRGLGIILFTVLLLLFAGQIHGQEPAFRRVCVDVNNNNLIWKNPTYPCNDFKFYIIWARNSATGAFSPIDTIKNEPAENYTHVNANIGPGSPNWFYFIERRDSCSSPYRHISDTLRVDDIRTEQTYFDSVSVDYTTNSVLLGWRANKSVDFNQYYVFLFTGVYVSLSPAGLRDTQFVDVTNNPSLKSITYDIYTTDSCGNPSLLGLSRHSTIFLQSRIDTCTRKYTLSWSHYIGWNTVKKYYIFSRTGSNPYSLIDSVAGAINTYSSNYSPGISYDFFVRAVKDTNTLITSSSNNTSFSTPIKKDPSYIKINFVTSRTPISSNLAISFSAEKDNDVFGYRIIICDTAFNRTLIRQ
jgi:hypothetical protein